MSDPTGPSIVIPATAEASSEYRLAQSQASVERERLKAIGKTIFKRGQPLDIDKCFHTTPLDNWTPPSKVTLANLVDINVKARVDKMLSDKGLAATIALTDTAAGVTEAIEYDENEVIVKPMIEDPNEQ